MYSRIVDSRAVRAILIRPDCPVNFCGVDAANGLFNSKSDLIVPEGELPSEVRDGIICI